MHTAATLAHLGPEALMAAVDRDVHASTDGARYATAIYGVLDASQRRLTLVNAGHPAGARVATRQPETRCVSTPPGPRLA